MLAGMVGSTAMPREIATKGRPHSLYLPFAGIRFVEHSRLSYRFVPA